MMSIKYIMTLTLIFFMLAIISMFGWRFSTIAPGVLTDQDKLLATRLKDHVYTLSHTIGDRSFFKYEQLLKAADYIEQQFQVYGYQVESQIYQVENKPVRNLIVTKRGTAHPEHSIVIGAHYDTCANPGADDNASGIASVLELARMLAKTKTDKTIKFVAFVNEEPPFFKTKKMGSYVYVKAAKEKQEKIDAAIILEMLGFYSDKPFSQKYPPFFGFFFPNKANFIAVVGNFKSSPLVKSFIKQFKNNSEFPIESISTFGWVPGVDFSDHYNFWKAGYPAVMVTDTAFYRTPHYHTKTDTYELLDYHSMARVTMGLKAVLLELAITS